MLRARSTAAQVRCIWADTAASCTKYGSAGAECRAQTPLLRARSTAARARSVGRRHLYFVHEVRRRRCGVSWQTAMLRARSTAARARSIGADPRASGSGHLETASRCHSEPCVRPSEIFSAPFKTARGTNREASAPNSDDSPAFSYRYGGNCEGLVPASAPTPHPPYVRIASRKPDTTLANLSSRIDISYRGSGPPRIRGGFRRSELRFRRPHSGAW
jgi:hypothetical protein